MTTPTTDDYAAAQAICALPKATYSLAEIAHIIAAHRAAPPPEPEPKADPAQAHATELETVLAACKLQMVQHGNDTNWDCGIKQEYIDSLNAARALLAMLDAKRKAQR